jgi:hypothetical protein
VYQIALSEYFTSVTFAKPTGDGLMVIWQFDEDSLVELANQVVNQSLRLVADFPVITVTDRVINFPVPSKIGIGVARGAACRLFTEELTLDYSGRVLNLAARLMDLARPEGVVLHGAFGLDLLQEDLRNQFTDEMVYIRGINPDHPMEVYFTIAQTTIPQESKVPPGSELAEDIFPTTVKILRRSENFLVPMTAIPRDGKAVTVLAEFSPVRSGGRRDTSMLQRQPVSNTEFMLDGRNPTVSVPFAKLAETLAAKGVKSTWPVTLRIRYDKQAQQ